MPRRNLLVIVGAVIVSLVCYARADRNPLGRYFAEVADKIEQRYVHDVDRRALWTGAVRGMIEQLGDPYSDYMPPDDAAELDEILDQRFAGIGIQVTIDPETKRLTVISPLVGSPAYRAGILAGDVIAEIDGRSTKDLTMPEAVKLLRGKVGEPVQLSVEREGQEDLVKLPPIRREFVSVESVMGDTRESDDRWKFMLQEDPPIGYVRIVNFGSRTAEELQAALEHLRANAMKGLIVDLRNNPGGSLETAVDVCNLLLPSDTPIVSVRTRDNTGVRDFKAKGGEKFLDVPLVVLVNHGSASASELVAAAVQDAGRGVVVGDRTWGKGTVQSMIPLHGGRGALRLTTADYIRPNGHNIHRRPEASESDEWGVSPDPGMEVEMTDEEREACAKWRADRDIVRPRGNGAAPDGPLANDSSLRRAVEYLKAKID